MPPWIMLIIEILVGLIIPAVVVISIVRAVKKRNRKNAKTVKNRGGNKSMKPQNVTTYFRWQKDNQIVIRRSAEQQRIVDEYFIIKNVVNKRKPLLIAGLVSIALATLMLIIFLATSTIALLIVGLILLVPSIILLVQYNKKVDIKPGKVMTDHEYDQLVADYIEKLGVVELGLTRLGLDSTQIKEIKPIILKNGVKKDESLWVLSKADNKVRSSTQYVMLLYFTDEQLFVYKYQFDMCCNMQDEWTNEFFYKDICDVWSHTYKNVLSFGNEQFEYGIEEFKIVSTNSSIGFTIDSDNADIGSILAMKQKIREKKNQ